MQKIILSVYVCVCIFTCHINICALMGIHRDLRLIPLRDSSVFEVADVGVFLADFSHF